MSSSRAPSDVVRSLLGPTGVVLIAGALSCGCAFMGWAPPAASNEGGAGASATAAGQPKATDAKEAKESAVGAKGKPGAAAGQSNDRDGDGFPDATDKCPDVPEDRDGFQDDDGCPDPDNDGDGVLDSQDHCPNQAAKTLDGCPPPAGK